MTDQSTAIDAQDFQSYYLIKITGKFVSTAASEIKKTAECGIGLGRKLLLIDLSETNFIDSNGIGTLAAIQKQLQPLGGRISLVSVPANLEKILQTSGLLKIFKVFNNLAEADLALRLNLDIEERGFFILFKLPQEFDLAMVKPLRDSIDGYIKKEHFQFVFDFTKTTFISSIGIGILINLQKNLAPHKGGVHLINLSQAIHATLEVTQIFTILPEYASLDEVTQKLISE